MTDDPMTRDPHASAGDGLRQAVEAVIAKWAENRSTLAVLMLTDLRALLAAHPEPGEAASVGDGLAGLLKAHDAERMSCLSDHGYCCPAGCHDTGNPYAHVAAVIVRDWLPGQLRAARAEAWDEGWEERDNDCSEPYSPPKRNPYTEGDGL